MAKALTSEKQEIIRKYYPVLTPQEVADMVGMKKQSVIAWAHNHGISNNRYWTKQEEEYLVKKYGKMTVAEIAKKLKKSYRAVMDKINHLGIGNYFSNSLDLSLAEVCRLVGRDKETIKTTWVKYGLIITKKGKFSMIREQDLLDFMRNNPNRWNATKCESWYFDRYDWYQEKKKKDWEALRKERWKNAEIKQ